MSFIKPYQPEILLVLSLLVLVLFGLVMSLNSRIAVTRKTIRQLLTGPKGEDLETLLKRSLVESGQALEQCEALRQNHDTLADEVHGCLQKVGLIRYDAYGDVTGKQSFSLALLNQRQNGVIITSLFGRQDGRCYGKAVTDGKTEQSLSEEEADALQQALGGPKGVEGKRRFRA